MSDEVVAVPYLLKSSNKKEMIDAWRSFVNKLDARMVGLGNEAGELNEILRPNTRLLDLLKSISELISEN